MEPRIASEELWGANTQYATGRAEERRARLATERIRLERTRSMRLIRKAKPTAEKIMGGTAAAVKATAATRRTRTVMPRGWAANLFQKSTRLETTTTIEVVGSAIAIQAAALLRVPVFSIVVPLPNY
jgi:hypothetical protein